MSFQTAEFGPFRSFFWPIYRHELRKIFPMMMMAFLICFNYSILRNLKDAVVITAQSSGAEVIPFIKVWVLLPMAIFVTLLFTKLSNRYSQERVFYIIISSFLVIFGFFAFLVFPLKEVLHPHHLSDQLELLLPAGFKGLIAMFRNWSFTLFYVICELWGSLVLGVIFWGFANEITRITEARRFYSMLGVIASFAAVMAGITANMLTHDDNWDLTLNILVALIISSGILTMAIFRWMNLHVLKGAEFDDLHLARKEKKAKKKPSIWESFAYLSNSKYLICIAILVISYNLVINLVEIVWKDQLRQLYSSAVEYNRYMSTMTSAVGIIATLTSLFMAQLIARFGWTRTALITPMIMLVTSAGFFAFMLFRNDLADPVYALIGTTPLVISVFFGASQVCLSKACKYSVFDSTKEMAFIPLGHECKLQGKAAIDGVGSRLGKSGGSLIHQSLLLIFATVSSSAPYVAVILMLVIVGWIIAVRSLGKQFISMIGDQGREELGEASRDTQAPPLQPAKA
jgi:AAA family ATP:ADP antiporter